MTEFFYQEIQQDLKLTLAAPLICAVFRLAFILVYGPDKNLKRDWKRWYHCFRYGFWWGMDFNAYVFLFSFVLVTIPSLFLPGYREMGDMIRLIGLGLYLAVLYTAFMGKMIFYFHFHDIYNHTLFLGGKADKKNLMDIFFRQNHGGWILLGYLPYLGVSIYLMKAILAIPPLTVPVFDQSYQLYVFNFFLFAGSITFFYWLRYGGTLKHVNKPEWDEVPPIVKDDVFFSKAVVDDLVRLDFLRQHGRQVILRHSDEESAKLLTSVLPHPEQLKTGADPLEQFRREASGPVIRKPRHIFLLFGEGYAQAPFDSIYEKLHIVEGGKSFRKLPGTVAFDHFLSGGTISQTSLVSLLSGIFDVNLELNENQDFWNGNVPTAMASQLKKLGYRTVLWYGGSLSWGSLKHYAPAAGFDDCMDGIEICPKNSPRTWLGVYDHIFLENAARLIREQDDGKPVFHFVYTTSNHGPYKIPVEKYGFSREVVMPDLPKSLVHDKAEMRRLSCWWYADKALNSFAEAMRSLDPDSLIIMTGDHSTGVIPMNHGLVQRSDLTLRERFLTSFAISHPELRAEMFAGNRIGTHMNILATLMELAAPKGFSYYSLFPSLTDPIEHVVTPHCWLDREKIGSYGDRTAQSLDISPKEIPMETDTTRYNEEMLGWCELTGWMARHPELLKPAGK